MGSLVLYIMEWAFALIVLLTIYKAVFSGTTFNRFNRFYLLGATVFSALLPLVHITIPEKTPVMSEMAIEQMEFAQELSGTFILIGEPQMMAAVETPKPEGHSMWAVILVCMYSAYVLMLLVGWLRSIIRARRFLRGKPRRRISRTVWLVTHDEDFGPFSWMNYIVISDTENGFARRASLRHEFSHVRLLHSVDLVFLLACTIVNPVCWLVLQEIKVIHEYEADNEVVNRYGIRNGDYQKLLIMRTVGAEAYALASSFNLNIKKRIIMLNKNQTRKRRLMWLLLLIPMLGITSVLFAHTEKSIGPDDILTLSLSNDNEGKESVDDNSTFQVSGKVVDQDGNPIASADFIVIPDASGLASLTKCSSDRNGEFAYSTSKGELVTISKQGYIPIKVSFETSSSDLTITLQSIQNQTDNDNESQLMVVPQTVKAGDIIHGFVANAETGVTIPMVNIYEKDANNRIVAHAVTDNEGNFSMKILDPNDVLIISHPEYAETQRPIANGPISIRKLITGSDDESAMVIQQPEFPGGTAALMQFLSKSIKYPAECRDSSIEGRVIVSFVIGKDGDIIEPEVVKSVHPLLDAEALRVISLMPNWAPGMQQGQPVRVKYSVPITFRLNGSSRPTPEWIYLFDAKNEADDDNVGSLLMSVARSNEDLGSLNTPEIRAFIDAYRSAQKEAQALTEKYQEEMRTIDQEIQNKMQDYDKQREELSESMRASYEQEIARDQQEMQQKYQEMQAKMTEWSNDMINSLQSQIKAAWESVSKDGAYICTNMPVGIPDESVVVTPDNLESALKDLFEGRRTTIFLKYSPANYQQIRTLLSEKYADRTIFYPNMR